MTETTKTKKEPKTATAKKEATPKAEKKTTHASSTATPAVAAVAPKAKVKNKVRITRTKVSKSDVVKALRDKVQQKPGRPRFTSICGKKRKFDVIRGKFAKWRKPHGIDLRRRRHYGEWVSIGFGNDNKVKTVHPSGFKEVFVNSARDLDQINGSTMCARFSGTIGLQKRKQLYLECQKRQIHVVNF